MVENLKLYKVTFKIKVDNIYIKIDVSINLLILIY